LIIAACLPGTGANGMETLVKILANTNPNKYATSFRSDHCSGSQISGEYGQYKHRNAIIRANSGIMIYLIYDLR
jgi:hypothetical protein